MCHSIQKAIRQAIRLLVQLLVLLAILALTSASAACDDGLRYRLVNGEEVLAAGELP